MASIDASYTVDWKSGVELLGLSIRPSAFTVSQEPGIYLSKAHIKCVAKEWQANGWLSHVEGRASSRASSEGTDDALDGRHLFSCPREINRD